MSNLLPNQVYAGLNEILKDQSLYYYSKVGLDYCHLTDKGKEEVVKWLEKMAPHMVKVEKELLDKRAKEMVWDELKK
jgi:DNA-binding PadR family transcriptional regulator